MGIEDFRTSSRVSQKIGKQRAHGSPDCPYGISGEKLDEIREKIDQWLKENSDRCYISSMYISEDLDISQSKIGYSLNVLDYIDSWAGASNFYINPYSEIGELE